MDSEVTEEPEGGVAGSFARTIERVRLSDLLLMWTIPAVLVGVFSLPVATRETLVFEYIEPSVGTAFTSLFVHFDGWHLVFNLAGYAIVVSTVYLLDAASGNTGRFRIVFVSLILACPVPLSYLNLAIATARAGATFGFSGVLMALYGYLALSLASYLESELDVGRSRIVAPLLFFVGLTIVTVLTLLAVLNNTAWVAVDGVRTTVNWVLAATLVGLLPALVLVIAWYLLTFVDDQQGLRGRLSTAVDRQGYFELAVVAAVVYLLIPVVTFPVDPTRGRTIFNLYVHFVGYALGFIASYLYWNLG